ncbi:hypothetical protein LGM71_11140 [Burkholderia sp. AU33545]|uniref:hypothetical protein n=1 Tax=Burkholderia sp. AU33545 TaxID=2879631 RepID=UPI001CF12F8C|nr:hypothetical protein [Burkholderia sp. AU33545]MCA8201608.1 hypothetical protein [Burkholderia sp. AU33545]
MERGTRVEYRQLAERTHRAQLVVAVLIVSIAALIVDTLCHPVASPRDAIHHDAPTHPVLATSRRSDQVESPDAPDARRTLRSGTENGHERFE